MGAAGWREQMSTCSAGDAREETADKQRSLIKGIHSPTLNKINETISSLFQSRSHCPTIEVGEWFKSQQQYLSQYSHFKMVIHQCTSYFISYMNKDAQYIGTIIDGY